MLYKLIAYARGFREAWDYDQTPPLLVVWHGVRGIHFTGPGAWRKAALS